MLDKKKERRSYNPGRPKHKLQKENHQYDGEIQETTPKPLFNITDPKGGTHHLTTHRAKGDSMNQINPQTPKEGLMNYLKNQYPKEGHMNHCTKEGTMNHFNHTTQAGKHE